MLFHLYLQFKTHLVLFYKYCFLSYKLVWHQWNESFSKTLCEKHLKTEAMYCNFLVDLVSKLLLRDQRSLPKPEVNSDIEFKRIVLAL